MMKIRQLKLFLRLRYMIAGFGMMVLSGCTKLPGMPPDDSDEAVGYEDCWPCQVYQTTFEAVDKIVDTLAKNSCKYALSLLGLGILFWLLYHVVKFITTIKEPNIREFLFPMTTTFFKAVVVVGLIAFPVGDDAQPNLLQMVGQDAIQPVLKLFSELSKTILDYNDVVKSATEGASVSDTFIEQLKESLGDDKDLDDTLFGDSGGPLVDVVYRVYIALSVGAKLGFHIFASPGFVSLIFGLFIICMFWMMLLIMPLTFLDAIVRICAMVILLPFLLVGWVFPLKFTKQLLTRAWGVLLGSGLLVMFTCFYVSLVVFIIESYATAHEADFPIFNTAAQEDNPLLVMQVETLTSPTLAFFVLMLALNKLSAHIPELANQFGGEAPKSSMIRVVGGIKKLSIAAGKAAIALAVASPTIAKEALGEAKDVAKSVAQDAGKGE